MFNRIDTNQGKVSKVFNVCSCLKFYTSSLRLQHFSRERLEFLSENHIFWQHNFRQIVIQFPFSCLSFIINANMQNYNCDIFKLKIAPCMKVTVRLETMDFHFLIKTHIQLESITFITSQELLDVSHLSTFIIKKNHHILNLSLD